MKTSNKLLGNGINRLCEALGEEEPKHLAADALLILSEYQESARKPNATLQKISEVLELVLVEEGPYMMITENGKISRIHEVTREEMLQHHIEVTIQEINELLEDE